MKNRTIAALSSAHGKSAISVIRLSGSDSLNLLKKHFKSRSEIQNRRAVYGTFDTGSLKDDVVAVYYKAPNTYTGEDLVEICCHGSPVIVEKILLCLIKDGAAAAERGEFTRRAFENGRLTLTEAEGIADLIDAQSESGAKAAYSLASGALAKKIDSLKKELTAITSSVNVEIDYPEEDVGAASAIENIAALEKIKNEAEKLTESYESGRKVKSGVSVVIAGRPNAGKSTLLNALVGYERAIVTEEAGTTRDTVEASYLYKGVLFNLTDTAGVRENADSQAERKGIERSYAALKEADIVLLLDSSLENAQTVGKKLRVGTKSDIESKTGFDIAVSGKTGAGIEELKELIFASTEITLNEELMLTNIRQYGELKKCAESLSQAIASMKRGEPAELVTVDLLIAMSALSSVDGASATREVVDGIFSRFCVGK